MSGNFKDLLALVQGLSKSDREKLSSALNANDDEEMVKISTKEKKTYKKTGKKPAKKVNRPGTKNKDEKKKVVRKVKVIKTPKRDKAINPITGNWVFKDGASYKSAVKRVEGGKAKFKEEQTKLNSIIEIEDKRMRKKKGKKLFTSTIYLFKLWDEDEPIPRNARKTRDQFGRILIQIKVMTISVSNPSLKNYEHRYTYKTIKDGKKEMDNPEWIPLIEILLESDDFSSMSGELPAYIDAIYINTLATTDDDPGSRKKASRYSHINLFNFAGDGSGAIFSKFTKYEIDKQATEFGKLFKMEIKTEYQGNFRANSCFVNLLMEVYAPALNRAKKSNGVHKFKELTFESLCEILQVEDMQQDIGLTVRDALKFFEKYRLGLDVFDVYQRLIFRYRPERLTKDINPRVLRIMVHNNHTYRMNGLAKHLQQVDETDLMKEVKLYVSDKFNRREEKDSEEKKKQRREVVFIESLDEVTRHIKTVEVADDEEVSVRYIHGKPLNNILIEMVTQKYEPAVSFCGKINALLFTIGDVKASIEHADISSPSDAMISLTADNYETYVATDDKFFRTLTQEKFMSVFSDEVLDFEENYKMGAAVGYLTEECPSKTYGGLDFRKAYTSCLMAVKKIPVFDHFDRYESFDGHEIEDYTMYLVEANPYQTIEDLIRIPHQHCRCYGFKLKLLDSDAFTIKYHMRPSRIIDCDFSDAIKEVYATDMEDKSLNKFIVNKTLGMVEKWENRKTRTKIFQTFEECQFYQLKYGGVIHKMEHSRSNGVDEMASRLFVEKREAFSSFWLLVIKAKARLIESFRPVKEMVYELMSVKLCKLYTRAVKAGLTPVAVKTDCVLVDNTMSEARKAGFSFNNVIGGLKWEKNKFVHGNKLSVKINALVEPLKAEVRKLKVIDEWKTDEFTEIFDKYDRVIVTGSLPGVGKSHSVKEYQKTGKRVLFVCPFNKLCQSVKKDGLKAITSHKLLNDYADRNAYAKGKQFDVSEYDAICFDEVFMYSDTRLKKIDRYMSAHPDIKFIATGDLDQLQPIQSEREGCVIPDMKQYRMRALDMMFPNQIQLEICKRVRTEKERETLKNLKADIFDAKNKAKTFEVLAKYFPIVTRMSDVTTTSNICYFNHIAKKVSSHIHKQYKSKKKFIEVNGVKYYEGMEVTNRERYAQNGQVMNRNFTYTIKKIMKTSVLLVDENEPEFEHNIKHSVLSSHFALPYASTCHSYQGLSNDEKMTIFDTDTPYVDRYFTWTAITRATDLTNIQIFKQSESEIARLMESRIAQYFKWKVEGYKKQDKAKNREWKANEYISYKWFCDQFIALGEHRQCEICSSPYESYINEDGKCISNVTADRIDNSKAHTTRNCRVLCLQCNRTRK